MPLSLSELEALVEGYEAILRKQGLDDDIAALRAQVLEEPSVVPPWLRKEFLQVEDEEGFFATLTEAAEKFESAPPVQIDYGKASFYGSKSRFPALKTIVNTNPVTIGMALLRKRTPVAILADVTGVLKPSTLTLILGCPQSGKSSLLKLFTGRLPRQKLQYEHLTFNGEDVYNGEFTRTKVATYIDQFDTLTPVPKSSLNFYPSLDFIFYFLTWSVSAFSKL